MTEVEREIVGFWRKFEKKILDSSFSLVLAKLLLENR